LKLLALYQNPLVGDKKILPRDIRNYVASIMKDYEDVHSEIMGHKSKQPTFIFSLPNKKSFAIYTFKKDKKTEMMLTLIARVINENPKINIRGTKATVRDAFTRQRDYTNFEEGLFERRLRTPMVIAVSKMEYAQCREISKDNKIDMPKLKKFVEKQIKDSIAFTARDWFGEEAKAEVEDIMDETIILFKDLRYLPIKFKEGKWLTAVTGTIISSVNLPQFIGYASGLGYGELSDPSQAQRKRR